MSGRHPDPNIPPHKRPLSHMLPGMVAIALCLVMVPFFSASAQIKSATDDPCPSLEEILSRKTPDDLSLVQADIDRYTLCAKRAELLKQLNEISTENEKTLGATSPQNPGMMLPGAGQAIAALPPEPQTPPPALQPASMPMDDGNWKIREIFGSSGNLQAKLAKSDGNVVQVKAGAKLPDGSHVLVITPLHVTLRSAAGETDLSWQE